MPRVLVIDDDPQMRTTMRRILVSAGHEIVEASNGLEGLDAFHSFAPDVVITDIIMPEKEGIETIIELSRATHRAKILAVSGSLSVDFLTMAKRFGADLAMQKPFRAAELLDAVNGLLPAGKTESDTLQ